MEQRRAPIAPAFAKASAGRQLASTFAKAVVDKEQWPANTAGKPFKPTPAQKCVASAILLLGFQAEIKDERANCLAREMISGPQPCFVSQCEQNGEGVARQNFLQEILVEADSF